MDGIAYTHIGLVELLKKDSCDSTKKTSIQPLRNELLIKPFPPKETIGSMVVPNSAKQRPSKALVLAVGRGTKQNPMILQKDDVVFHVLGAGDKYELENGEIVWMVRSTDCLAYIPKEN